MKNVRFEDFPKLGFGIMRVPMIEGNVGENPHISCEGTIDEQAFKYMLDEYMASGMNYFDTAHVYYDGKSEKLLGKYLIPRYDRESFYLASKLPFWGVKEENDLERLFNESLERCNTDYFDLYLMHCLNESVIEKIDKFGGYEFMKRLKKDGKAIKIGFSFHDTPDVLELALNKYPDVDFIQLQINYLDWNGPMQSEEFYRIARKHNKPIIIMEPVRGGALSNLGPEVEKLFKSYASDKSAASWALRFCSSLQGVCVTLSGMSSMEQMKDNINTYKNFEPINDEELKIIKKVAEEIVKSKMISCTGCRYCKDCPSGIDIAGLFTLYNDFQKTLETEATVKQKYKSYENKPAACVECGACEAICPQKLNIMNSLKEVKKVFG